MTGLFSDHPGGGPRFYQAPPGVHLSRLTARGVLRRLGGARADPAALARMTIYVGTRRGARALREAFAHEAGRVTLTPRILAFPDVPPPAGSPPAAAPLRRVLSFARLVRSLARHAPDLAREEASAALALQIADLLDEMLAAKIDPEKLKDLAPDDHAAHWAESLKFLKILGEAWPEQRRAWGVEDAAALRVAALESRIEAWKANPPETPILVAGEAGRSAVERDFIHAAARLPQGAAILPWLDDTLGAEEWLKLDEHPEHPGGDAAALLKLEGLPRDQALWWEPPAGGALARARLLGHALRPPPFTDAWSAAERRIRELAPEACAGLSLIEARSPREEAAAVAAVMRRVLAEPGRTVALVTPDRALGRRTAAALGRWGIEPDDSGGRPLALTAPGILLSLLARVFCGDPGKPLAATELLSLLKHPLAAAGAEPGEARRRHLRLARRYERFALRGRRLGPGLEGLAGAVEGALAEALAAAVRRSDPEGHRLRAEREAGEIREWICGLTEIFRPLAEAAASREIEGAALLAAQRRAAFALSDGASEQGPTGEALKEFLERLEEAAPDLGPISPRAWPALFADLLRGEAARPPGGGHRRAFVWGPADARAQTADVVIIGGLNEGVWPASSQPDGWLSRPMRRELGLESLEAEAGRLAQDFARIACGTPEVWLTRARKQGGAPASASRWLRRLEILLGGYARSDWEAARARGEAALRAAREAEADSLRPEPEDRPAPRPPVERRPRRLSVTRVETLVRDPYAIYAREILGLEALPALEAEPDALSRGRALHQALESFVKATRKGLPPEEEALALFAGGLEEALTDLADRPALQESWRVRAMGFARDFLPREAERRKGGERPVLLEARGEILIPLESGRRFRLTAEADRIDDLPDGGYLLVDYKTGTPPGGGEVRSWARQLPLEAAILRRGGFPEVKADPEMRIRGLRYVSISPGAKESDFSGFKELGCPEDLTEFSDKTLQELIWLLEDYEDPQTPYLPRLRPRLLKFESPYDHLARVGEWGGEESGDGEEGGEA
ncbi:double-strand break repair protein AddB [Neomegalonema sp.]|uniref:double-strand break repair protein AddB n=1 Tax=Neomegalonema sp. TaxID=2039713 RepID=UPI00262AA4A1|nr:double-strand break repair protein AddB [Neomegalonema sp.]MDD2869445.1 double-strand break repair protein AddB [Neomegalonema sp.]